VFDGSANRSLKTYAIQSRLGLRISCGCPLFSSPGVARQGMRLKPEYGSAPGGCETRLRPGGIVGAQSASAH
jgi:hypothetical protein